jgi:DnaJ-class molecular chaperone
MATQVPPRSKSTIRRQRKFKELNEANEVLRVIQKAAVGDAYGENCKDADAMNQPDNSKGRQRTNKIISAASQMVRFFSDFLNPCSVGKAKSSATRISRSGF